MATGFVAAPTTGDARVKLAQRLLLGAVLIVSVLVIVAVALSGRREVLVAGLVGLVVALGLAALFARQISAPLTELRDVATALAAGDLSKRPALSAPGEVGELAVAVRRMAEELDNRMHALQAEDELLGALIESLDEGVVAVDRYRRVIRINRSGRQLLGVKAQVPFSVDLLPRDRTLHDALGEALSGGVVERVETRIGSRTLALTARPLGIGGAVLALFDLTGLRRLEAVRRDFVANVSHELKTPLTAIRGFAETLSSELAGDHQHTQFADTIRANAERMQNLIDDLLDLSKIESGGWAPTPATVDIAAAAAEAVAPYREESEKKGAAIEIAVEAGANTMRADPVALRQALGNLIENAVRYTPSGGTITIFSRIDDHGIVVGVRDTGSGIPAEHLPRIFERFYRVDPARSRAAGGTGLGLAIVKHLVEAHGGRVHAESKPGQGTTVSLFFPTAS